MSRRKTTIRVVKKDQERPTHVRGQGDVLYRGFQCAAPGCTAWLVMEAAELAAPFEFACTTCAHLHRSGDAVELFDYDVVDERKGQSLESGTFKVLIDDYVNDGVPLKYCLLCYALKPVSAFDSHASRRSGVQGECRSCKQQYNALKNPTRTRDQLREAAQRRRLFMDLAETPAVNSQAVADRFGGRCFNCDEELKDPGDWVMDHTLPASYLWPLTRGNATLLCARCNGQKADKWPGDFYGRRKLKQLAAKTGFGLDVLKGPARFNPDAIEALRDAKHVTSVMQKWASETDEILKLRNKILSDCGFDILADAKVSPDLVTRADQMRNT